MSIFINLFYDYKVANNIKGVYKRLVRAYYKMDFKKIKEL